MNNISGTSLALSGGVGGAKLALGLAHLLPADKLAVVANTGDDFEHLGLCICPDIDTLLYTLAGLSNTETGWGRAEETWSSMTMLATLGGEAWFRLGDKDLALHLYRTARLRDGANLSEVTEEVRKRLQIGPEVLPMSDQPVRTHLLTPQGLMPFQQYFVRARCEPRVTSIQFTGAEDARMTTRFSALLREGGLKAIIICPSNPYLSIDPILAVTGVRRAIEDSSAPVIAVSPIVGGGAIKGPTAKLMAELGVPVSAAAVAEHYKGLIDGFVLDRIDAAQAKPIEESGIACSVTNTVMRTLDDRMHLARDVLDFADTLGPKVRQQRVEKL